MQNVTHAYFYTNAVIYYFLENQGEAQTKIAILIFKLIEQNAKPYISEIGVVECFYGAFTANTTFIGAIMQKILIINQRFI